jgi:hypothetical protein
MYLLAAYVIGRGLFYDPWKIGNDGPPAKVIKRAVESCHFSADLRRVASRLSLTTLGISDRATGKLD